MTDRSDKTTSPQPNELANLEFSKNFIMNEIAYHEKVLKNHRAELRKVEMSIRRACGDAVVPRGDGE